MPHQQIRDGRVPETMACPRCQERAVDALVFIDDITYIVECQSCATQYDVDEIFTVRILGQP